MKKVIETDPPTRPPQGNAARRGEAQLGAQSWKVGGKDSGHPQGLPSSVKHERTPTDAQSPMLGGLSKWVLLLGCCGEGMLSGVDW